MGLSTKQTWAADAAGTLLLYEPERLTLITDPAHPLYDDRVHLPVDPAMVASIKSIGVHSAVSCVRDKSTGQILVAAGRQRVKAAIEANRQLVAEGRQPRKIPVLPRDDTLSKAMIVSASENAIRTAETPIQRAHKMRAMLDVGHDMATVAEAFGCTEATVESTLALLQAHPVVQAALADGSITTTHAAQIMKLKAAEQPAAVATVVEASAGVAGHERARKQRAAVAAATGAPKTPALRGKREIREAMGALGEASHTRAVLQWVLGEADALPEDPL